MPVPPSRIPLNDLSRYATQVAPVLAARASTVIAGGHYVLGPNVTAFEQAFAAYCGSAHCIGVGNGTDALELALRGCGVGQGDAVVVCANAAMYGTGAVLAIGAIPVFADVDADGLLTAETIATAIAASTLPPRAVIVTHLYGRLAAMDAVLAIANAHGLRVIEDCAQAHGARDDAGRMAGSWGDAAAFSFYPTKNLGAVGDGGAVLCQDQGVAERVRQLRQYGWTRKYHNTVPGGRNSRLDELQAAFLLAMLPDLEARNARRHDIARRYSQGIVHPLIRVPDVGDHGYVAHLYVVRSAQRDALATHLASAGVVTDIHYPTPDYRQPAVSAQYQAVTLPATEAACTEVLSLPCFPELRDDECEAVIAACNAWAAP